MANKMTKRERFEQLLTIDEVVAIPGMKDWILHEQELLAKKNSSEKKMTKTQMENESIKDAIYEGMEENTLYTISDLGKQVPALEGLSGQKISALVRQMIPIRITRIEEKRKAYFQKVVNEE